jgi:hypothetical protein
LEGLKGDHLMGRTYSYDCPKCGYSAKVCGGEDRGLYCKVRTYACLDCHALYDAIIEARVPVDSVRRGPETPRLTLNRLGTATVRAGREPRIEGRQKLMGGAALSEPHNHLPPTGRGALTWVKREPRCPVSRFHRMEPWKQPGQCPRCRTFLEQSLLPFRVWE